MKLVLVGSVDNIFCQCGVKGHRIKKIYLKKLITCNSLIVGLMDSVL